MRTTIDIPDALYRKTKAVAALRGSSVKELVIHAVEREISGVPPAKSMKAKPGLLPQIRIWHGPKLDLSSFDFDDLLS